MIPLPAALQVQMPQTLSLFYSNKNCSKQIPCNSKVEEKTLHGIQAPPLFWYLKLTVSTVQPPPSIRSKLHPKHRHRHHRHRRLRHVFGGRRYGRSGLHWWIWGRRCSRLRWIVGIRLGDTAPAGVWAGWGYGRRRLADFSDFRCFVGNFLEEIVFFGVLWLGLDTLGLTEFVVFFFGGGNVYTKNKMCSKCIFSKRDTKESNKRSTLDHVGVVLRGLALKAYAFIAKMHHLQLPQIVMGI